VGVSGRLWTLGSLDWTIRVWILLLIRGHWMHSFTGVCGIPLLLLERMSGLMLTKSVLFSPLYVCLANMRYVARVLKLGGQWLYITYRQPHFMKPLLVRDGTWELEVEVPEDPDGGRGSGYFVFIMSKLPSSRTTTVASLLLELDFFHAPTIAPAQEVQ
jgi:hypothetical protein